MFKKNECPQELNKKPQKLKKQKSKDPNALWIIYDLLLLLFAGCSFGALTFNGAFCQNAEEHL